MQKDQKIKDLCLDPQTEAMYIEPENNDMLANTKLGNNL